MTYDSPVIGQGTWRSSGSKEKKTEYKIIGIYLQVFVCTSIYKASLKACEHMGVYQLSIEFTQRNKRFHVRL